MGPLTVVFWENEPQFSVVNPEGSSQIAALNLEARLHEILGDVIKDKGADWDCGDFRKAVKKNGLEVKRSLLDVGSGDYWRFDAEG